MCAQRVSSQSSVASMSSIGMGGNTRPSSIGGKLVPPGGGSGGGGSDEMLHPKLLPEGVLPSGQTVYDCIVYLIYCAEHDRIAVTNVEKTRVVWFPFVVMPDGVTWDQASHDGIAMLMGKRDSELDATLQAGRLPKYQMSNLHVLRVQMPSERFFVRLAQFVNVEKTDGYKCCEQTPRITWLPAHDILNDRVELLWGPEVKLFTSLLIYPDPRLIFEFSLDNALSLLVMTNNATATGGVATTNTTAANVNYNTRLLASAKIQAETVLAMYQDYVEHCFPSFFMSLESFKVYLIKYGYSRKDNRFPWLFNAIGYTRKGYVDFYEYLIGIVCLEPNTEHTHEARCRMLFRYYDVDYDQTLSVAEFAALLQDLYPKATPEELRVKLDSSVRSLGFSQDRKQLSYEAFQKALTSAQFSQLTSPLCRSPKAIIPQIRAAVKKRTEATQQQLGNNGPGTTATKAGPKRKDRGICNGCRAQNYEYCLHCVYFDTAGRCVKPLRLNDVTFTESVMTPQRYSAEYVFGIGSICNMFIDVIRDHYRKNEPTGLMATVEEAPIFARYVNTLCEYVSDLFVAEEKLLKLNAPVQVIGDLLGNLDCIFGLERMLWQSVPVLTTNFVFLGNYCSAGSCVNVEVITYLLALKMLSPNKVILLRGHNETREQNKSFLLYECQQKYGNEVGKYIWDNINDTFDKLPFGVVVDESIICLHSGIPKSASRLAKFLEIPEEVKNVEKESPLAYEIISNVPNVDGERSASEKAAAGVIKSPSPLEFNSTAFGNFMKANNLTYLIRGHEVYKDGYRLHFTGNCITVSTTLVHDSTPAVVFIDGANAVVRVVKLDIRPNMRQQLINV